VKKIYGYALSFLREDDAATMVEYALLVVLIAMVVTVAALALGHGVSTAFNNIASCVNAPTTGNGATISTSCTRG
jgi:Flp pilus assembly pilin Flp